MALCSKHAATLPHFTLTNQLGLKLRLIVYTQVLITLSLKYNMNEIACNYYVAVECHNITFLHSINLSISWYVANIKSTEQENHVEQLINLPEIESMVYIANYVAAHATTLPFSHQKYGSICE
jgi:hypothetical protein